MNNYCIDLNLNIPFFNDEKYVYQLKIDNKRHQRIDHANINPEIFEFFKSKNLKIGLAESFFRRPGDPFNPEIHKDAINFTDASKINWVYDSGDSVMEWYKPINNNIKTNKTAIGVSYEYYDIADLELVHTQHVGFPSLVQVGLPHNIANITSDRLCISVLFIDIETSSYIPFEKAKMIFQNELVSRTGVEPVSTT